MTETIAIVGSGFIGRGWAISYARAGMDVALYDAVEGAAEAALGFIDVVLQDLARHDLLGGQDVASVRGRLRAAKDLPAVLDGATYVQENTPEVLESRRAVYRELDRLAGPDVVLASSTSSFLPSLFTEELPGRARCIVAHPLNPPYLVPAVEVVPATWTAPETVARTQAVLVAAGHEPIMLKKEIDGFVVNRLQGALLQEAFKLVAEGYADPRDVDRAVAKGLGLRWSFIGPFEVAETNAPGGVKDYIVKYEALFKRLWSPYTVPWGPLADALEAEYSKQTPRDKLRERQLWRDRRLIALAAHKRDASGAIGE